jgi:hypothetical protein
MSMLLKGTNGSEFELDLTREERPDPQDGFGDGNWATVNFRAATADDSWEETAPAMNLFEFSELAQWLQTLGDSESGEVSELELLQPELKFSVAQQGPRDITLRIGFHLDGRPDEFEVDSPTDDAQYLDLHLSRASLRAAATGLRQSLDEVQRGTGKDDLRGDDGVGGLGVPEEDLGMIDRVSRHPPGAGTGEDNAGNR